MKRFLAVVLPCAILGACAKGGSTPLEQGDASNPPPGSDANEDFHDAPPQNPDAPPAPDAFVPDAFVIPIDAPPDACVPVASERLVNPVLDLTPQGVGWVDQRDPRLNAQPGGPFPIISPLPTGLTPVSAPNMAWLGGAAGEDISPPVNSLTDQLFQDIPIPANATQVTINGFFLVGTQDDPGIVFDTFSLDFTQTNGTPIENVLTANNTTVAGSFTPFSHTISAGGLAQMVGKTVRLRAIMVNDVSFLTNVFLDSFSVQVTACP